MPHYDMTDHIVVFYPEGTAVEVTTGETVLAAARQAGVSIDSSCGGVGACGKCRVILRLGHAGVAPGPLLSPEDIAQGYALACQTRVEDDLVAEVPTASQLGELQILTGELEIPGLTAQAPLVQRLELKVPAPTTDDNCSDLERLERAVCAAAADYDRFAPDLAALASLPGALRAGEWQVCVSVADDDGAGRIIDIAPSCGPRHSYGLAVDVGTTTVAVHLVDIELTTAVAVGAALNAQIAHGEDVIARIIYADEHDGGRRELQREIVGTVNSLVGELCAAQGIEPHQVLSAACAGNTVMSHLLLGLDPAAIRRAPYVPAARRFPLVRAGEIGLAINPIAPVHVAPCVSSYVGGDVVAGVLATGMAEVEQRWMLLDMGTNGELALGNKDWLLCCSCSAGPAFEGSGIEYGMHASLGAIERARYDTAADALEYVTIGGAKPRGVCGSGLIDVLATLLRAGVIDRAGKINLGYPSPRVRVADDQPQFVLVWGADIGREDDIVIKEADIENLVRSKAAVFAGAQLLLESVGLTPADLERVMVAGAFGNYLDSDNAVTIGLLPDIPLERIRFVGNTSVAGARMMLVSRRARRAAAEIASRMANFELSAVAAFMDRYVAGLFLPHTDMTLFPSVAGLLEQAERARG
ncbi:MAG TPA: ASKHA domain-containing protein [Armatimonadota bacterium]|nr:ASKHA domain-containing protein [Armatimonadota bacterium]